MVSAIPDAVSTPWPPSWESLGGSTMGTISGFAVALGLTAVACALLIRFAHARRWLDGSHGEDAGRKLQSSPVPPVGGTAWLLGVLGSTVVLGLLDSTSPGGLFLSGPFGVALAIAFGTGLVDDLRPDGLRPRAKLLGQTLAAVVLVGPRWIDGLETWASQGRGSGVEVLALASLWTLGAVLAQNAWNTFDNSDGAAPTLGAVALLGPAPPLAGALLGFLPFNLLGNGRTRGAEGVRPPRAYLGDSGSHLVGLALFTIPSAWPVFTIPILDLGRVVLERRRAGQAPWVGDRRHLAHRMLRRGLGATRVALLLMLLGLPAILGVQFGEANGPLPWIGMATTVAGFAVAVLATQEPKPRPAPGRRENSLDGVPEGAR